MPSSRTCDDGDGVGFGLDLRSRASVGEHGGSTKRTHLFCMLLHTHAVSAVTSWFLRRLWPLLSELGTDLGSACLSGPGPDLYLFSLRC